MSRTDKSLDRIAKEYLENFRNQPILGIGFGQDWGSTTRFNENGKYDPQHPRHTINIWQAEGSTGHADAPLTVHGSDGRQGVPGDRTGTKSLSSDPDVWKKSSAPFELSTHRAATPAWTSRPHWLKNELLEVAQTRHKDILEAESKGQLSVWEWIEGSLYEKRFVENNQFEIKKEQEENAELERAKRALKRQRLIEKSHRHKEMAKQERFERKWPKIGELQSQPKLTRPTKPSTKKIPAVEQPSLNQKVCKKLPGPQLSTKMNPIGNRLIDQTLPSKTRPNLLSSPSKHSSEQLHSEQSPTTHRLNVELSNTQPATKKRSNKIEWRKPACKRSMRFPSPSDRKSWSDISSTKASRFGKLFRDKHANQEFPSDLGVDTESKNLFHLDPNAAAFVPGGASWDAQGRK